MATILTKGGRGAPQVDLTPMVDLGFLLISFFMFTTTMSNPKAMHIVMPYKSETPIKQPTLLTESTATTLLPTEDGVYYYNGIFNDSKIEKMPYAALRDFIVNRQKAIDALPLEKDGIKKQLQIVIKPLPGANTDQVIGILDEMRIHQVGYFVLVDIEKRELDAIYH